MRGDGIQRYAATGIDAIDVVVPPRQAVVVVFDPTDPSLLPVTFSTASASDLVPVLRVVLALLEAGALRMPVDGGVRWVDVVEG